MYGFGYFGGPDCRRCGGYYPGNPGAYSGSFCQCRQPQRKQEKKQDDKGGKKLDTK